MKLSKTISLVVTALCLLVLMAAAASAAGTPVPVGQVGTNSLVKGATGNQAYTISQTLSDQAQETTIAFDALAFLTGSACSDTFLPPGKVADYAGFQYLRDNDPTQMGHNTDFVTRASDNVLSILNADQLAQFVALSKTEAPLSTQYGYMRFPLMKAFRAQLEGTIPAGSSGLDKAAVMAYSSKLYDVDASISLGRAKTYASVIRSLNQTQRAYLDKMASGGMLSWPVVDASAILKNSGQDNSVAMRTYASEMFSWYAGSVEADTYFCPERQATYFGSFYLKDGPAIGNSNYSISTTLTGDSGEAALDLLTVSQRGKITGLVDIQRADLNEIVAKRQAISTELRHALAGGTINETLVRSLSARYGELDGEISYYYATHFADVRNNLTSQQMQKMMALRNLNGLVCSGAYLYSQPISMPQNIPSNFLFGVGTYNSSQMSAWLQSQQGSTSSPVNPVLPANAPTVSGITPSSGKAGTTVSITNLAGTNFRSGATVKLQKSGQGDIIASSVGVSSPTAITCKFVIPATTSTGNWDVVVSNSDGTTGTKTAGFSIVAGSTPANPTISGLTPSSGKAGSTVSITNLAGTNFRSGATVKLQKSGQKDIVAGSVVVYSTTTIRCKFIIPATASIGTWNVVVTNPDGTTGMKTAGFSITK